MMLEIVDAEGIYLYTADGKRIMDLISGIGVSALGHSHPSVVEAVQYQASKYMHTMVYGEFILSPQVMLASLLVDQLPSGLECVYFVNSGAEAVEGALKLAKRVTGRYDTIACYHSYHGSTHGAAGLMSDEYFTKPYRPLIPQVRFIHFNHVADLSKIDHNTACVVMETVQAERGLYVPDPGYLKKVALRCQEVGALLILDEIQAGYGRTGKLFAFERYGVVPDILCLAKGMGGGMPIGAFIASKQHMDLLNANPVLGHITTFGGHPVNCAAALATLQVVLQSGLIESVSQKSDLFLELLPHPQILEIRHSGLWFALTLKSSEVLHRAVKLGLEAGLLFDWFLFDEASIRLAPPLIITDEEIFEACQRLHGVLDHL